MAVFLPSFISLFSLLPLSLGKRDKKTKERKEPPPAPAELSDSEHEAPAPSTTSGKERKKTQRKEESPPPIVQPPDSEHKAGSLINDVTEEQVPGASTRSKRRRSSVAGEEEPARLKGKHGRPPGKRAKELETELAQLELEPIFVDDPVPPTPKRTKRGRPPGIPAREMGKQGRPEPVQVVDEPAPSAPKRKRGRPPGIPSRELEEQSQPIDDEPAPSAKRKRGPPGISSREMEKQAQSRSESVVNESSLPRPRPKRGGPPGIPLRKMEERVEPEPVVDGPPPLLPRGKRGRPPGKRPAELEAEEKQEDKTAETEETEVVATSSPAKAISQRARSPKISRNEERVVPDSLAESSRGRKPATTESSTSAPRRLSLPRRRRQLAKADPPKKTPSDELLVVPDSDEEKGRRKTQRGKKKGLPAEDLVVVDPEPASAFGAPTLLSPDLAPEPSPEAFLAPALPAHRLRAVRPRVKVADEPHPTEVNGPNAIAVKARFMKRATNGTDQASGSGRRAIVSGSKAGPGRSSATLFPENNSTRLTVLKGVLTSVKPQKAPRAASELEASLAAPNGDASMEIDDPALDFADAPDAGPSKQFDTTPLPEIAPTGQELLNAAGMDERVVQDLPDFEEDAEGEIDIQCAPDAQIEVYVFMPDLVCLC